MIYKDTINKFNSDEKKAKFSGSESAKYFWKIMSDIFFHVYLPVLSQKRVLYKSIPETITPQREKFNMSMMKGIDSPSGWDLADLVLPYRSSQDLPSFMLFMDELQYSMDNEPTFNMTPEGEMAAGIIYDWNSNIRNNVFHSTKGFSYNFPDVRWSTFDYDTTITKKDWNGHDVKANEYYQSYWNNFVPSRSAHEWFRYAYNLLPIYQTKDVANIGCGVTWLSPINKSATKDKINIAAFATELGQFEDIFATSLQKLLTEFPTGLPSISSTKLGNLLCHGDAYNTFTFQESMPIIDLFVIDVLNFIKFAYQDGHLPYTKEQYQESISFGGTASSEGLTSNIKDAENANAILIGNGGITNGSEDFQELPVYTFPAKVERLADGSLTKSSFEDFPNYANDYIVTPQRLISENLVGLAYDWDCVLNGYDTIVGCNFSYDNYVLVTGFEAQYGHIENRWTAVQVTACSVVYSEEKSTPTQDYYLLLAKRQTEIIKESEWVRFSQSLPSNTLGMQRQTTHSYQTMENPYLESTVDYSFGIYCHNVSRQGTVEGVPYFDIFDDDSSFTNIPPQYQPFNKEVYLEAVKALFPNTPEQNKLDEISKEDKRHDDEIDVLNRRKQTTQEQLDSLPDERKPLEENIGVNNFKVCLTDWLYKDTSEYSAPIVDAINQDLQNYLNQGASSPFTQAVCFMEAPPYGKTFYIDDYQWMWDNDSYFTNPYGGPNSLASDLRDYFFFAMSALNARGWYDDKPLSYAQAVRILNDYCNGKDGITFLKNFATLDNEDIFQGATFEWKNTIMEVTTFIIDVCSNYISDLLNSLGDSYLKRRMDTDNKSIFNRLKQECQSGDMLAFEAYWLAKVKEALDNSRELPEYQEYWNLVDELETIERLINEENELHIQRLDEIDKTEFPLVLPTPEQISPLLALVTNSTGKNVKPFEKSTTSIFSVGAYIPYTATCGKNYWELFGTTPSQYPDYNPSTQSSAQWQYDCNNANEWYEFERDYTTTCDRYPIRNDVIVEYLGALRTTIAMDKGEGCENYSQLYYKSYVNDFDAFDKYRKEISDACYETLRAEEPNYNNADKFIGGANGFPTVETLQEADYDVDKYYTAEEIFEGGSHEDISIVGISPNYSYTEKVLFVKDNSTAQSYYDYKEKVFISISFSNGVVIDTHDLLFSKDYIVGEPLQSKLVGTVTLPSTVKLAPEFKNVPEQNDIVFTAQYFHKVLCKTSEVNGDSNI